VAGQRLRRSGEAAFVAVAMLDVAVVSAVEESPNRPTLSRWAHRSGRRSTRRPKARSSSSPLGTTREPSLPRSLLVLRAARPTEWRRSRGPARGAILGVAGEAVEVRLEDLTVRSARGVKGHGTSVEASFVAELTHVHLTGNSWFGLWASDHAPVTLVECALTFNGSSGLTSLDSAGVRLEPCAVHDNTSHGLLAQEDATLEIYHCEFTSNGSAGLRLSAGPCIGGFDPEIYFSGRIEGSGYFVPGPGEPSGNEETALCPPPPAHGRRGFSLRTDLATEHVRDRQGGSREAHRDPPTCFRRLCDVHYAAPNWQTWRKPGTQSHGPTGGILWSPDCRRFQEAVLGTAAAIRHSPGQRTRPNTSQASDVSAFDAVPLLSAALSGW